MIRTTVAAAALGFLLVGCGGTSGSVDDSPPAGTNADAPSTSSGDDATEDASAPADDGPLKFGQAYTYDDGLTVKVSKPVPYEPSQYATSSNLPAIRFTVTIVNKTGKPFDPTLVYLTMQSGNKEAEQIFDSAKGLNGSPMTKVLDGRESQFDVGFNVKNPKDLVLDVSLDAGIEYDPITYVS